MKNQYKMAQGFIGGALRGGVIIDEHFCSNGPVGTYHKMPVGDVNRLKVQADNADEFTITHYMRHLFDSKVTPKPALVKENDQNFNYSESLIKLI